MFHALCRSKQPRKLLPRIRIVQPQWLAKVPGLITLFTVFKLNLTRTAGGVGADANISFSEYLSEGRFIVKLAELQTAKEGSRSAKRDIVTLCSFQIIGRLGCKPEFDFL